MKKLLCQTFVNIIIADNEFFQVFSGTYFNKREYFVLRFFFNVCNEKNCLKHNMLTANENAIFLWEKSAILLAGKNATFIVFSSQFKHAV